MFKTILFFLFCVMLLAACSKKPKEDPPIQPPDASAPIIPQADIPPLEMPEAGPVRSGCGDYRLLVKMETDAQWAGMRVSGPAGAVDVVWNLAGPGLAITDPATTPHIFNEDNREIFGINRMLKKPLRGLFQLGKTKMRFCLSSIFNDLLSLKMAAPPCSAIRLPKNGVFQQPVKGNNSNARVTGSFILLISGVQSGEMLTLEMGQGAPGSKDTDITITNTRNGFENGPLLAHFKINAKYQTETIDLCAAESMPAPADNPSPLPPRLVAFYYPWWGTTAGPNCAGDASGWQGEGYFVTPHTPIAQDDDWTIYTQTDCWMEWTDENNRSGLIYDVTDTNFITEQMQLAQATGIDAFAVSVHGDNTYEMNFLAKKALPAADRIGFRIAALYEAPENGWTYDTATDAALVGKQLRRIVEAAAQNTAYLTLSDADPRLVIFIDPAIIGRLTTPQAWATVRAEIDKADTPYFLFGGPAAFAQIFTAGLDGVFNDLEVIETFEIPLTGC